MGRARSAHRPPIGAALSLAALCISCDGSFSPDLSPSVEYAVERFEVVEEDVSWASLPIATLHAELTAVNTGWFDVELELGACPIVLVAARPNEEEPAWRSWERKTWPTAVGYVCAAVSILATVQPGDSLRGRIDASVPIAEILADSLPVGEYDFRAFVAAEPDGAWVDLGRITLPESRFPMADGPARRDGFIYEVLVDADSDPTADARLSLVVSLASYAPAGLTRTLSASCPLRVLAFHDAAAQVAIPEPTPAWVWPASCDSGTQEVRPDAMTPASFERTLSRSELLDRGVEPGRYALTAYVDVDERPIRWAVGELDVRSPEAAASGGGTAPGQSSMGPRGPLQRR